ncbi:group 1 glycosyl transferase [Natrinema versiforme JCM 10478]|uniref:Group 1 glycosyl transferase n=2 Tax=Natrinema versiforme TaxID=88724 RepID=L9XNZ7_9EURY|nr:group 1 glycosyl transferase [Natrinema versiforme JCM 10478]
MTDNFTSYKFLDDLITFSRAAFFLFDLLLVSFFSISIVWTVHNKQHHEKKYSKTEKLINEALFLVSDGVTVKCKSASGTLSKMYRNAKPSKMHVVPDGNYMGAYQNNVGREESREDLGITSDSFVYLYFGLIREYKGVPELISQFSELPYNDIELWVVGQPWNEKIERELSKFDEQVDDLQIVPKYIDDEDVQNYMNAADVLVLPYRDILNSGSAHLGLSFGVPVIAPKIGCIPAVFPKENKFLYDPDVKDSLKVQLEEVYNSTELKSVSSANYERALDQNWDETARKLEEVYQYSI